MSSKLIPFVAIILLLGAIQGIILSANLILSKNDKRQAKYFLSTLIILIVFELLHSLWFIFNSPDYEVIHFLFLCLILTFPPNLFLYVRAMTQTEKLNIREIIRTHSFNFIVFFVTVLVLMAQYNLTDWRITDDYEKLLKILMLLVFWFYYQKSYTELHFFTTHNVQIDIPEAESQLIRQWLNLFLKVIFGIATLWTIMILCQMFFSQKALFYIFITIEVIYVIAIYWIGYAGFQRVRIIYLTERRNSQAFFNMIPPDEIDDCLEKLQFAMENQKSYLDPELNLQKLASAIGISYKIISAVLNQKRNMGFNEYINTYRIEEFKKRITDPKNAHLNIAGVAFDSGFNSLATFQRSFKNITGITPKDFIKENSN